MCMDLAMRKCVSGRKAEAQISLLYNIAKYSKIPDQTVYVRWLIWSCTVHIYPEDTFPDVVVYMINNYMLL